MPAIGYVMGVPPTLEELAARYEVESKLIESSKFPGKPHGGYWVKQGSGTNHWLTKVAPGRPCEIDFNVPAPHNTVLAFTLHGPDIPLVVQQQQKDLNP
mmetsp:Transcript_22228/g.36790  ORF Transcript_22228/g.36790 Transcript_22228/m.36790 type:complete len:99 (+) Transcript_22228:35-331(+)